MRYVVCLSVILLAAPLCLATTIHVPSEQPTIQAGIDAAVDGDTVLVAAGTYSENINFLGKNIKVIGLFGAASTTLQPAIVGEVIVSIVSGETNEAEIAGFTIQNSGAAAALHIHDSSPIVRNNVFWSNNSEGFGAALHTTLSGSPNIHHNLFDNNGGIANVWLHTPAEFCNNTIVNSLRAGIIVYHNDATVENNIVVGCPYYGITDAGDTPLIDYNDFYGNGPDYLDTDPGPHDISTDPLFSDPPGRDFTLQPESPCIDAGDPNSAYNDPDGTRNDMGAFPHWYPTFELIAPVEDTALLTPLPTFVWHLPGDTAIDDPFNYTLYWDDKESFSAPESVESLSDTFWVSTVELSQLTKWYWEVRAVSDSGRVFLSDEFGTFYIDYWPSAPQVFSPQDSTELVATGWLIWMSSIDLDEVDTLWYHLQIDLTGNYTNPIIDEYICEDSLPTPELKGRQNLAGLPVNTLQDFATLTDNTYYFWRIRAHDKWGAVSDYTSGDNVFFLNTTNDPPNPVDSVMYPQTGEPVNNLTPTIVWYPASDPDLSDGGDELHYTIQLDSDGEFDTAFAYEYTTSPGQPSITVTSSLEDETHWYYRIEAIDDEGASSAWSAIYDFWTNWRNDFPDAFSLLEPTDDSTAIDPTPVFHWQQATDSDPVDSVAYTFFIAVDSSFQFSAEYSGLADTFFVYPDSLPFDQQFWWKVKAEDAYLGETWSTEIYNFKTVVLGDASGDGIVNVSDVVFLVAYIFAGGQAPYPLFSGDADCNGIVNVSDAVYLIAYVFGGGPPPCEP